LFPGSEGGGEWGGVAIDPDTDLLYVNSNEQVWLRSLEESAKPGTAVTGKTLYLNNCAACHGAERLGAPPEFPSLVDIGKRLSADQVWTVVSNGRGRMPAFNTLPPASLDAIVAYIRNGVETPVTVAAEKPVPWDTSYRSVGHPRFLDRDGYPAITPPWGTLNAINMNSGAYAWKIPLGEYPELAAKGLKNTGSDNYGGPIVTAGGLVIIAATNYDNKIHAFDKQTGKLLWEATLPFPGNATPATYEVGGRQFIVIATSSSRSGSRKQTAPAPVGARYVAFALPNPAR
jgi:quinoprotein glucose dehydrogenase